MRKLKNKPRKLILKKDVNKYKSGRFIRCYDDDDEQSIGEETSLSY